MVKAVKGQPGVVAVVSPTDPNAVSQISEDKTAAFASLGLNGTDRERAKRSADLQDVVASAVGSAPVEAYLTGYSQSANDLTEVENADVERAESIGIPVALIVLVLALGAVIAGFIPLIMALVSLMFTFGVLSLLIIWRPIDSFLLSIVTMIGVGISIDYSLFILTRFREELVKARDAGQAEPVVTAVGVAMRTSGRTILFSGTIVMISLFSLFMVKSPLFIGMALGAVLVVICTLLTAWTMLPALLAVLGDRVNRLSLPKRFQPATVHEGESDKTSGWARWARTVLRHPWLAIPAAALLILFALPMFGMELGIDLGLAAISDTATGKAEIILTEKFSPGLLSPIQVLASHEGSGALTDDDLTAIEKLTNSVAKDKRVAAAYSIATLLEQTVGEVSTKALKTLEKEPAAASTVAQMVNTDNGSNRTIITVVTKAPIDSTDATELVRDLRDDMIPKYTASAGPQMLVGGETAQFEDLGVETLSKLPLVMAIVLTLSFLYLMIIFRSLLIPAKAVLMNLMATFAAFGLTTWVFADGSPRGPVRLHERGLHPDLPADHGLRAPLRPVHGLRGVPRGPHAGAVAAHARQRRRGGDRGGPHGADDHRGGRHHGRGVRLLPRRRRAGAQGVRLRAGDSGHPRRHDRPAAPGAGDHEGRGRQGQLVAAWLPEADPASGKRRVIRTPRVRDAARLRRQEVKLLMCSNCAIPPCASHAFHDDEGAEK